MDVRITVATREQAPVLAALLELYVYDFSPMLGLDVGDDGRFRTHSLDPYWADPKRHAFLIHAGDKLAGLALVSQKSRLTDDESVFDMAEFFVLRRYRGARVGATAATWLFDRFRGVWEIREKRENVAATVFWRRVLARYTGDRFEDLELDDDRWRGPVQRFDSRAHV